MSTPQRWDIFRTHEQTEFNDRLKVLELGVSAEPGVAPSRCQETQIPLR